MTQIENKDRVVQKNRSGQESVLTGGKIDMNETLLT